MAGDKTYITDDQGKLHRATRVHAVTPTDIVWSNNRNDYSVQVKIDGKWHRAILTYDVSAATYFDNVNIDKALVTGADGKQHTALIVNPENAVTLSPIKTDEHALVNGTTTGETAVSTYSENWSDVKWQDNVNVYKVLVTGSDGKVHTALLTTSVTGGVEVIIKGTSPLNLPDAIANSLSYVKAFGGTEQSGTPTPNIPVDIVSNNGALAFRDTELPSAYRRILGMTMNNDCYYEITGFKMNGSDTLRFSFTRTGANACNVLGAYDGTSAQSNYSLYAASSNSSYLRYNGGTYNSYAVADKKYDVVITPTGSDGMETDSTWTAKTFTSTTNLCIGTTSPSATSSKMVGSIHGSVVVDGRLELIPCERISDGELGYYDTYTDTFYEPIGTTPTSLGYDYTKCDIVAAGPVETINVHGKNLNGGGALDNKGYTSTGGTSTSTTFCGTLWKIKCKEGEKYTVSFGNFPNGVSGVFISTWKTDGTWNLRQTISISGAYTYTIPAGIGEVNFTLYKTGGITIASNSWLQVEKGETATTYEPYYDGGTATAEMLLKVGDYQDEQEILSGAVTRKVGITVFDGTESWSRATNQDGSANYVFYTQINGKKIGNSMPMLCTHYVYMGSASYVTLTTGKFLSNSANTSVYFDGGSITTVTNWKNWLATQYANGTPVIVIYPLATETTETVTGQTLQVTDGDNTLEITQAGMDGLELEVQYDAAVSLTVQEVEDANLDNNVTVTIQ